METGQKVAKFMESPHTGPAHHSAHNTTLCFPQNKKDVSCKIKKSFLREESTSLHLTNVMSEVFPWEQFYPITAKLLSLQSQPEEKKRSAGVRNMRSAWLLSSECRVTQAGGRVQKYLRVKY